MPHCIIEYSNGVNENVNIEELMVHLQSVIVESELFDPKAIKLRAIQYQEYLLTDGVKGFLHVRLKILSGRSEDKKTALSRQVFQAAGQLLPQEGVILTVEIHEMDARFYLK
jgi:5-carboxymethyl-2-hydroxymuconate isomerase